MDGERDTPELSETATRYVFGELSPDEMAAFEARVLAGDEEAAAALGEVEAVSAALLGAVPAVEVGGRVVRRVVDETGGAGKAPADLVSSDPASADPASADPASADPGSDGTTRVRTRRVAIAGWIAAAAAGIAAAELALNAAAPGAGRAPSVGELIARGAVALEATPWEGGEPGDNPEGVFADFSGVGGRVAWDAAGGIGVADLAGLPPSRPGEWQYQAWVVDATRPTPVPAGVFHAGGGGSVVVFRPAVPVRRAAALAITAELEGGVLVPSLRHRVAIAAIPEPAAEPSAGPDGGAGP